MEIGEREGRMLAANGDGKGKGGGKYYSLRKLEDKMMRLFLLLGGGKF